MFALFGSNLSGKNDAPRGVRIANIDIICDRLLN